MSRRLAPLTVLDGFIRCIDEALPSFRYEIRYTPWFIHSLVSLMVYTSIDTYLFHFSPLPSPSALALKTLRFTSPVPAYPLGGTGPISMYLVGQEQSRTERAPLFPPVWIDRYITALPSLERKRIILTKP